MMLVLTLEGDHGVIIRTSDGDIRVVLAKPLGGHRGSGYVTKAKLCFEAPPTVGIWREGVLAKPDFRAENQEERAERIARLQRLRAGVKGRR